jgi:hypothetical protein
MLVKVRPSNEALLFPKPLLRGVAKAALDCAHRATIIHLIDPSKLACYSSFGGAPMLVYVRPSNEVTDDPSKLARYLSGMGAD